MVGEKNEKKVEFEKQQCVVISIVKTVILSFEITDFFKKDNDRNFNRYGFPKKCLHFSRVG